MPSAARLDPALSPDQAAARLDPAVRDLVAVVASLYAGSWGDCAEDIRRRRAGRPYLFRIDLPLADELPWLGSLDAYERLHGRGCIAAAVHVRTDLPSPT